MDRLGGVALAVALLVAACGGDATPSVAPEEIGHVHDLVAAEDAMLIASHRGLHRLEDGRLTLVGDEVHDLMAMTVLSDGDLVASGHPDLRLEQYRVDGAPSYLGLARSSDFGATWSIVGLLGEADFHALVPTDEGFYGADSARGVWRFDADGRGARVGTIPFDVNDLAVSPDVPVRLVATSYEGEMAVSDDEGQTWEALDDAPRVVEIEWAADGVTGVDANGTIWTADDPLGRFRRTGQAPGEVQTLLIGADGNAWMATHGGQVWRRTEDATWESIVGAP